MSKKCADCGCEVNRNVIQGMYYCPRCDDDKREIDVLPMTVFDHIKQSPEVISKFLVFHNRIYKGRTKYHSSVVGGEFDSYEEAIAATVAKLKEVVKDEQSNLS